MLYILKFLEQETMKEFFKRMSPAKTNDVWLYYLIFVAILPFIYLACGQIISYLLLNVFALIIFVVIFLLWFVNFILKK